MNSFHVAILLVRIHFSMIDDLCLQLLLCIENAAIATLPSKIPKTKCVPGWKDAAKNLMEHY